MLIDDILCLRPHIPLEMRVNLDKYLVSILMCTKLSKVKLIPTARFSSHRNSTSLVLLDEEASYMYLAAHYMLGYDYIELISATEIARFNTAPFQRAVWIPTAVNPGTRMFLHKYALVESFSTIFSRSGLKRLWKRPYTAEYQVG